MTVEELKQIDPKEVMRLAMSRAGSAKSEAKKLAARKNGLRGGASSHRKNRDAK